VRLIQPLSVAPLMGHSTVDSEPAIESQPVSEAWEASVLPLNYARSLFLIVLWD